MMPSGTQSEDDEVETLVAVVVLLLTMAGRSQVVQIYYGRWLTGSLQIAGHA